MPNVEKVQANHLNGLKEYLAFMAIAAFLAVAIVIVVRLFSGLQGVHSLS